MMRAINIVLTIAVFVAGFFLYKTIREPISFNAEFKKRDVVVISKLKYLRDLELAYKDVHGEFAEDFDELARFVKEDSITIVKIIGDPDQLDAQGNPVPVEREIIKIPAIDTLTNDRWPLDNLAAIPNVEGEKFSLQTSKLERGRIIVPVFKISAEFPKMLKGMNKSYIDPSQARTVGSLTEPSYNGNWEGK